MFSAFFFSLQTTVTVFSSARIQTMSVSSLHKLSGTLQLTWFSDSCIFLSISKKNSTTSLTGTQFTFFSSSSSVVVGFGTCCSQRQNDLLWVLLFLSLSVSDCLNVYATYDNIKQQQLKKKSELCLHALCLLQRRIFPLPVILRLRISVLGLIARLFLLQLLC